MDDVRQKLKEMGFTDEDVDRVDELTKELTSIVNRYYCPNGIRVYLGLKAVGGFVGAVLHRLPGKDDPIFLMQAIRDIIDTACSIMESEEKEEEESAKH